MVRKAKTYGEYGEGSYMEGVFDLDDEVIDCIDEGANGVYVLVDESSDGDFLVTYVGRGDLRDRLFFHAKKRTPRPFFAYVEIKSKGEAYLLECRLFHEYGEKKHLDNKVHPGRPKGSSLPACDHMGCQADAD